MILYSIHKSDYYDTNWRKINHEIKKLQGFKNSNLFFNNIIDNSNLSFNKIIDNYQYNNKKNNREILQDKLGCILSGNRLVTRMLTLDGEF